MLKVFIFIIVRIIKKINFYYYYRECSSQLVRSSINLTDHKINEHVNLQQKKNLKPALVG